MIAILSDFGDSEYVGVMKGAIYSVSGSSIVSDLCNHIKPYSVKEGAWILWKNYRIFPKKTVFLCVVDPGVGGSRQCIAIKAKNYFFVGPDNGLMHKAASEDGIECAVSIDSGSASKTFHGRDVFAKAAAMLDKGEDILKLGKKINSIREMGFHLNGREGEVISVDSFGNIITNIPHLGKSSYNVKSESFSGRMEFHETYEDAPKGKLFLVEGSSGTLEISAKNGSASSKMKAEAGRLIEIS